MAIDLTSLNPAQRDAVMTTDGPLLVLAGAGSGKTRVLTYRIAHLIGDLGVSPHEILAITFTNKAAAEMRERLTRLLSEYGLGVHGMWVLTFHAMCVRMLRADAELLGFTRNFTIYDPDDSKRMLKDVMAGSFIDEKVYPVNGVIHRILAAKNEIMMPTEFLAKAVSPMDKKAALVFARYQQRLLGKLFTKREVREERMPPAVAFVIRILRLRYVSLRSAQDAPLTLPHPEKRTLRIGSGCSRKASVIPSIVVTEPLPGQLRGGGEMANASVLKTEGRETLWVRVPPALLPPSQAPH